MEDSSHDIGNAGILLHAGRNIGFDALEANRSLQINQSVTSRESSVPVDLVWRDLTFDVPLTKKQVMVEAKLEAEAQAEPTSVKLPDQYEPTPIKPSMRRILHGLSGQVRSGQVLAIMGASGSGKTTLLNLLSGRMKSSKECLSGGKIFVNGASRNYASFPHIAKFVEQDDTTMFPELTVREQILYSARLALPPTLSDDQKARRVDRIIQELGLSACKDTFIGFENVRGVSGGERRRAAIGVELVTDPSLIFLDEPTTGLDSFNALNVMSSLRHLARNGRTIVSTIHQPRSSIYHLFDMLCLISEGRIVYFGAATEVVDHFSMLGFHMPDNFNVADFVIDILSIDLRTKEKEVKSKARVQYAAEHFHQNVEPQMLEEARNYDNAHTVTEFANIPRYSNSIVKEFTIIAQRTVRLMSRERQVNITRLSQTLIFAILLGLIWLNTGRVSEVGDRRAVQGVIFFIVINQ